ncbi:MAG TPA: RNA polymerase sigma factor [Candidatus Cybelea sp.]|nr:RNA polymerase sigma factor [Candidatus Cybelea sp.]
MDVLGETLFKGNGHVSMQPSAVGAGPSAEAAWAVAGVAAGGVICAGSLEAEFEQRLADCPTLAYRVALGVLRNAAEAEDVAQEAMWRAYRSFHRLRDRDRFRTWLVRTTWRLSIDRIRSTGRRERRERAATEERCAAGVESIATSREFARRLADALDALPGKLRIVMVLAAIEGYNTREVAKLVGVREGTVKSRLHLARKRLGESLRLAGMLPTISKGESRERL